jgi:SOS-response transcriptional repressor LexA
VIRKLVAVDLARHDVIIRVRRAELGHPPRAFDRDRRAKILTFIREYVGEHRYAPTVREIGKAVGLVSPSSVSYQLKQLAEQGALTFDERKPRAIVLSDDVCGTCHGTGLAAES